MFQELMPFHREGSIREDGMLFVRTEGILPTMVNASIFLTGIIIVAVAMPLQNSFSSTRSLDLVIFQDASTHISSEIDVDPLEPDFTVNLFGNSIDNFVAVSENDFLLSTEIIDDTALIETFSSSSISIDYDSHDLVSKQGRIWTFSIDAPIGYTVLMPQDSVIVGMSTLPLTMEIIDKQTKLSFPSGPAEINYLYGVFTTSETSSPKSEIDNSWILIGSAIAVAGVIGAVLLRKSKTKSTEKILQTKVVQTQLKSLDPETIFRLRPNLREDDKEIVNFIFNNGGKALESELRKKFLQPRTTMWRAVKRLERQGIVEIAKKEMQNLVKLTKELEEEN